MKTCLVVDDSRVIRKVARRILEELGFEVAEAADGMEAMAWCRTAMPEAILLDWNMPLMDGLEFLRQLRKEPDGDQPIVVFCTVENDLEHIALALESGADEYIMKPFDGDILSVKLMEAGVLA
ncbi:MAG: response regulator [Caulobacteraceae bacterium]|nr:response regulator [Caulobacteraceae bacterium]